MHCADHYSLCHEESKNTNQRSHHTATYIQELHTELCTRGDRQMNPHEEDNILFLNSCICCIEEEKACLKKGETRIMNMLIMNAHHEVIIDTRITE